MGELKNPEEDEGVQTVIAFCVTTSGVCAASQRGGRLSQRYSIRPLASSRFLSNHSRSWEDIVEPWRKARVAAGCPGHIAHDFRRTAVRNLVRAGVPERVAMQLTGHKTRAVFERFYEHCEA
jgi:integrase